MSVNEDALNKLLEKAMTDFGATYHSALSVLGDELGLYRALAAGPPLTSNELAEATGTHERYVREWLRGQAAGGYVTYDPKADRFFLTEEQRMVVADENSPVFLIGAFQGAVAGVASREKVTQAFRTGRGVEWGEHDPGVFVGTERVFRPGYAANLVQAWIPALDGVDARLREGARVADVGCGHGASTIIMAEAYPASTFVGFDNHNPSIEIARRRAKEAGVEDRVRFEVADAADFPGTFDFITMFDCYHDMGDPVGVAAHVHDALTPDGTWMLVEPYAEDRLMDNMNPRGRAFYAASTLLCTPSSLSQDGNMALGAQAGEARLSETIRKGGLGRVRRAAETPINMILEAKP